MDAVQARFKERPMDNDKPRVIASFRPQFWGGHKNDYAYPAEPECPTDFDVTLEILDAGHAFDWNAKDYDRDDLRYAPTAPTWAREWSGPFEVDVELEAQKFWESIIDPNTGLPAPDKMAAIRAEVVAERSLLQPMPEHLTP
jgi:hypothetical protein